MAQFQSLDGELRSWMLYGMAKTKTNKNNNTNNKNSVASSESFSEK